MRRGPTGKSTMREIRGLFAAILFVGTGLLSQAWATSFSTDQSDVWSVVGEDGWGFQLVQRGSVIFVTMYVYGPTNTPIWYTATLDYAGNVAWTGGLYLTNGPYFGTVPFNPGAVTYRKVGTITWTATSVTAGQLRYDVDGSMVVKNATRLLLRFDDFSGTYSGGLHQTASGCADPALNGTAETIGALKIAQNGQSIAVGIFPTTGGSCTFAGALTQAGQMGAITGTYACSSGETGPFQIFEMQVNPVSASGRFTATINAVPGCQLNGWFGGMRVTTF
jgi:hypothetical protein